MWLPRISGACAPWQVLLTMVDWKLYPLQYSAYCKKFKIAKRYFIINIVIVSYHGTADYQSVLMRVCGKIQTLNMLSIFLNRKWHLLITPPPTKKVTHLPDWNCHVWTEIRGHPTVQSPGGSSPHCYVSVFLQTLYTSSALRVRIRAALDGEQRQE